MSEERRQPHTPEPAEGADENVEAPGAERSGDPSNPERAEGGDGEERAPHPAEPAEGGEDQVEND